MPGRVVWYVDGSPAAKVASQLPEEFAPHPLSMAATLAADPDEGEVVLLDLDTDDPAAAAPLIRRRSDVPIVALAGAAASPDAFSPWHASLPKPVALPALARALSTAIAYARLGREAARSRRDMEELNAIGVRLSAERDPDALLGLILGKAREITRSDAGSIYLVEEPEGAPRRLRFKLAQNDTVQVPFTEFTMPISEASVAGHVALSGEVLQLDDAYSLPAGSPFQINRTYDQQVGYRTKSMMVVPMKTPKGEIIGVLQLINCKREVAWRFTSPAAIEEDALPYPRRYRDLAASLASQAAVALENNRLYQSISTLFEGFVKASVTAIEHRDPTTSGHSFRVADLTTALAAAVDGAGDGPFRDLRFSPDEMREIRYASLLHDFGKVGVREDVLVKAKKLRPDHLALIRQRVELIKQGIELRYTRQKLELLLQQGRERFLEAAGRYDAEMVALLEELDDDLRAVTTANEPSITAGDVAASIRHLATRAFVDHRGEPRTVLTPDEAGILSIARGSLTGEEFALIQSHVVNTFQFLSQIPWTRELRKVPEIARSHHEKLDGSGYPFGARGAEIPIQSRMMTISDIFDALTAADRPYKPAVPVERALNILHDERGRGRIEPALLDIFIDIKPWERR
jgi:HD-GYP domain-containing protein (c-di-GMP phosphodiesterase class II)